MSPPRSKKSLDLTGQQFSRWAVVERAENTNLGSARWLCQCSCGNRVVVVGVNLRNGRSKSCGCLKKERMAERARSQVTHGRTRMPEYQAYRDARDRCRNPNSPSYAGYGARGIKFLYANFEEFFADLGERPPGTSLERCNNHGHYQRSNCRWTTPVEQANNRRSNRLITVFSRTQTMARWAREVGISYSVILQRINHYGWAFEDALTRPSRSLKRRRGRTAQDREFGQPAHNDRRN
jgi:hypothetical protein